ncbi:MAG: HAMP domain-containing histidine kinase [Planctomycetales bacterium]|nr:HAMP domain-containing histidine kinase [Planctomycetales bacterium]
MTNDVNPLVLRIGDGLIPLTDSACGWLIQVFDSASLVAATEICEHILRLDPAILLWVTCVREDIASWHAVSISSLAEWLANNLARLHNSIAGVVDVEVRAVDFKFQCQSLAMARLARTQAEQDGYGSLSEAAYVCGMLLHAEHFLSGPNSSRLWPPWLRLVRSDVDETESREASFPFIASVRSARQHIQQTLASELDADLEAWDTEFPVIRALLFQALERYRDRQTSEQRFRQNLEEAKLESVRELAYGASHEINNPLTNISTRAQSLLLKETDPIKRQHLATIVSQAYRGFDMLADLMMFAKPPLPVKRVLDLRAWLPTYLDDWQSKNRQTVQLTLPTDLRGIDADPDQLAIMLDSILRNSVEWRDVGQPLSIHMHVRPSLAANNVGSSKQVDGEWVEVLIEDNGQGCCAKERRHAFDPFYSGREAGRGLGFGLSKAWRIARMHDGHIEMLASPTGKGTMMRIVLPTLVTTDVEGTDQSADDAEVAAGRNSLGSGK